jgi:uncharacterized membrane protein YebE (DUF533 family)
MTTIGTSDFNYCVGSDILGTSNRCGSTESRNNMNKNILIAVPFGLGAIAALVLSFRSPVTAESLIGYASVLGLLSVAALEYRISWKRLFGRS